MITEDQLEQLALQWFQDTGWSHANGADLAPEGVTPERADFRTVVLKARLAAAVRRLNPKLPPTAVEEVVHVSTTPTETSMARNNGAFDFFAPAQSGYRPALRAVGLARPPGGSAHRLLMDGVKVEFTNAEGEKLLTRVFGSLAAAVLSAILSRDSHSVVTARAELSAALHNLPTLERAALAIELIDSLGDEAWSEEELVKLAAAREAELESGTLSALSYEEFLSGLRRPASGA